MSIKSSTPQSNKVAVITGAASGIGKALAIKCLRQDMKVVLADSDKDKLDACEKELQEISKQLLAVLTNVANEAEILELANKTINHFGAAHYLFNNAGIPGSPEPLWLQTTHDVEQVLKINLLGTIYGIKAFVPIMLKQKDECYIINTAAGAGLLTGQKLSAYKASKHAIIATSEVLFADLKNINANINVAVLIPHWVATDIAKNIKTNDKKMIADSIEHLKQHGMSPTLVAEKVFDAIKEKAFYIFTHPAEHLPRIQQRMENILALRIPF